MTPQSNNSHNNNIPGAPTKAPAQVFGSNTFGSKFAGLTIDQPTTTPNVQARHTSTSRPSSTTVNSGFDLASQPSFIYATPLERRAVLQLCHDELFQNVTRQREACCRQIVHKEAEAKSRADNEEAEAKSRADNEERVRNEQVEKNFVNSTMIHVIELLGSDNPQDQQVASVLLQLLREQQQTGAHVGANQTLILRPSSARRNLGVHLASNTATQAIMIFGVLQKEARMYRYFDLNASSRRNDYASAEAMSRVAYKCAEATSRNDYEYVEAKSRIGKNSVTKAMSNIMKLQESDNPRDRQAAVILLLNKQLYLKNYLMNLSDEMIALDYLELAHNPYCDFKVRSSLLGFGNQ